MNLLQSEGEEVHAGRCVWVPDWGTCGGGRQRSSVPEKRTFTFLQDLNGVSNFQWEAVLDSPSETGQNWGEHRHTTPTSARFTTVFLRSTVKSEVRGHGTEVLNR